jgi:DNA (cytosine-5)-methyltransferase 1
VASVFSGIGSFEFALKRLGIEHEILFACDNGNRNVLVNVDLELNKIKKMKDLTSKITYENTLYEEQTSKKNFVQESYLSNYKI